MIELLVWANPPNHIETSTVAICLTSLVGVKLCLWHLNLSPILSWGLNSGNRHKLHSLGTLHNGGQPHTALPGASMLPHFAGKPTIRWDPLQLMLPDGVCTRKIFYRIASYPHMPRTHLPRHRLLWCCSGCSSRQMTYTFHRSCAWMQFLPYQHHIAVGGLPSSSACSYGEVGACRQRFTSHLKGIASVGVYCEKKICKDFALSLCFQIRLIMMKHKDSSFKRKITLK